MALNFLAKRDTYNYSGSVIDKEQLQLRYHFKFFFNFLPGIDLLLKIHKHKAKCMHQKFELIERLQKVFEEFQVGSCFLIPISIVYSDKFSDQPKQYILNCEFSHFEQIIAFMSDPTKTYLTMANKFPVTFYLIDINPSFFNTLDYSKSIN